MCFAPRRCRTFLQKSALKAANQLPFCHVTSRGNEQKDIFKSQKDRKKFLSYVESAVVRYGAVIHTWRLMRNHYHLLLATPAGNLAPIMRHLNGALSSRTLSETLYVILGREWETL
jgi:REP element-mobilizing transposase RayT